MKPYRKMQIDPGIGLFADYSQGPQWIPRQELSEVEKLNQLPIFNPQYNPETLRNFKGYESDPFSAYDQTFGAPARTSLLRLGEAEQHGQGALGTIKAGLGGLWEGLTTPLGQGVSGKDVAKQWGVSDRSFKDSRYGEMYPDMSMADLLGFGVEGAADLGNLAGLGAMAGMGKKVYQGSPHRFNAERLVVMPDGSKLFLVGGPDVLPDVPEGARVIQDFLLGRARMDKIGTGEGAQAFGHGLYFTDSWGIAKDYAEKLSDRKIYIKAPNGDKYIDKMFDHINTPKEEIYSMIKNGDKDGVKNILMNEIINPYEDAIKDGSLIKRLKSQKEYFPSYGDPRFDNLYELEASRKKAELAKDILTDIDKIKVIPGNIYTARIPEGDYLKWDEPLKQKQKDKLAKYAVDNSMPYNIAYVNDAGKPVLNTSNNVTGQEIYREITRFIGEHDPKKASEFLNKAGIKGIDYPAGSLSGVENSKARNYVIFSDEGITIEDIKKLMLLGAAGLGTKALTQE